MDLDFTSAYDDLSHVSNRSFQGHHVPMVVSAGYALEHFYYGQLFYQGKPQGELRLLASSPGVRTEHVDEAMSEARLPPMNGAPTGSWALVRGKTIPFMLAQAQFGSSGQAMRHITLMPVEVLRALGGNLRAMMKLIEDEMPSYDRVGNTIPASILPQAAVPSLAAQEDAMLALMTATRDRMDTIETLLAAIVRGVPLVILHAPTDMLERVSFIEGLLALLPPPARFGVTFATHTLPGTRVDAQIRFLNEGTPPAQSLVFDWETGKLNGTKVEDEYSRYIKSQLRLDTNMVIQQTSAMTAVAGWRLKRGDTLSDALRYAAYRLKIDTAISSGQPIDASEAAKVLVEDPTLTDELRAAYIRHLLAFALVLDEIEHADVLAIVVRGQPDLERVIMKQMNDALAAGKAERVYRTLLRWLSNPIGFRGMYWNELAHRAAADYAEILARSSAVEALTAFLRHVQRYGSTIEAHLVIPRLIDIALPLAAKHKSLAETVFLLAASSLTAQRWRRILTIKPLLAQLPPQVAQLAAHLNGDVTEPPPPELLAQTAGALGDEWRPLLTIRLSELALHANRRDLLDNAALAALVRAALTPYGKAYDSILRSIVRTLSSDDTLNALGLFGSRYLLQILLARGAYEELAAELMHQNRLLYPPDKMLSYSTLLRGLFLETPYPLHDTEAAIRALSDREMKPLPLAMAYFGALEQHKWATPLEWAALELSTLVFSNRLIAEAIPLDLLMQLLQFHVQRRDSNFCVRVAQLIPGAAARKGEDGIDALIALHMALDWDEPVRAIAVESLRRFVRRSSDSVALQAVTRFKAALGDNIGSSLQATYLLRRLMDGESLADYAYSAHTAAQFLFDTGMTYADKSHLPSIPNLFSDLDSMNGGLSNLERRELAMSLVELMRALCALATQHRQVRPRENDELVEHLIAGKGDAQSVVDIFRVMGGYFARGRKLSARADKFVQGHPLGDRSAPILLREVQQIARLLKSAVRTLPPDTRVTISAEALQGELESLWSDIALHERRSLVRDLAIDLQRIPEMTLLITDRADTRALQDSSAGLARKLDANRHRPENALEFYRFLHGYFKLRSRMK